MSDETRRDPLQGFETLFADLGEGNEIPEEPAEAIPQVLRHRPRRGRRGGTSRNRDWEKRNPVTGFRGIPPTLNAEIKRIAQKLHVPKGDIARAFLEYALAAYQAGELFLEPELKVGRYTLFPTRE